jgi:hypothetical protein
VPILRSCTPGIRRSRRRRGCLCPTGATRRAPSGPQTTAPARSEQSRCVPSVGRSLGLERHRRVAGADDCSGHRARRTRGLANRRAGGLPAITTTMRVPIGAIRRTTPSSGSSDAVWPRITLSMYHDLERGNLRPRRSPRTASSQPRSQPDDRPQVPAHLPKRRNSAGTGPVPSAVRSPTTVPNAIPGGYMGRSGFGNHRQRRATGARLPRQPRDFVQPGSRSKPAAAAWMTPAR